MSDKWIEADEQEFDPDVDGATEDIWGIYASDRQHALLQFVLAAGDDESMWKLAAVKPAWAAKQKDKVLKSVGSSKWGKLPYVPAGGMREGDIVVLPERVYLRNSDGVLMVEQQLGGGNRFEYTNAGFRPLSDTLYLLDGSKWEGVGSEVFTVRGSESQATVLKRRDPNAETNVERLTHVFDALPADAATIYEWIARCMQDGSLNLDDEDEMQMIERAIPYIEWQRVHGDIVRNAELLSTDIHRLAKFDPAKHSPDGLADWLAWIEGTGLDPETNVIDWGEDFDSLGEVIWEKDGAVAVRIDLGLGYNVEEDFQRLGQLLNHCYGEDGYAYDYLNKVGEDLWEGVTLFHRASGRPLGTTFSAYAAKGMPTAFETRGRDNHPIGAEGRGGANHKYAKLFAQFFEENSIFRSPDENTPEGMDYAESDPARLHPDALKKKREGYDWEANFGGPPPLRLRDWGDFEDAGIKGAGEPEYDDEREIAYFDPGTQVDEIDWVEIASTMPAPRTSDQYDFEHWAARTIRDELVLLALASAYEHVQEINGSPDDIRKALAAYSEMNWEGAMNAVEQWDRMMIVASDATWNESDSEDDVWKIKLEIRGAAESVSAQYPQSDADRNLIQDNPDHYQPWRGAPLTQIPRNQMNFDDDNTEKPNREVFRHQREDHAPRNPVTRGYAPDPADGEVGDAVAVSFALFGDGEFDPNWTVIRVPNDYNVVVEKDGVEKVVSRTQAISMEEWERRDNAERQMQMEFVASFSTIKRSSFHYSSDPDIQAWYEAAQQNNKRAIFQLRNPVALEAYGGKIPMPDAEPIGTSSDGLPIYRTLDLGYNPATGQRMNANEGWGGAPAQEGVYVDIQPGRRGEVIDIEPFMSMVLVQIPLHDVGKLHHHHVQGWVDFKDIVPLNATGTPFRRKK